MDAETLARSKYLSLTTFRRDGTPVATAVWLARDGERLVVVTSRSSGKAKRLRNDPRVRVAPCDMRGQVSGEAVDGVARLQDPADTEVTLGLIRRRYGVLGRLAFRWGHGDTAGRVGDRVGIAIELGRAAPGGLAETDRARGGRPLMQTGDPESVVRHMVAQVGPSRRGLGMWCL